jgi:hypothetical protein
MILNGAAMSMAAAGTPGNFIRGTGNAGNGNMRTFISAGMMFVCKGEGFHRFRRSVGRAAGMHEGMVMRLDLCLPVIGDAGNKTRRSYCREPQGAQQHTKAYTLFHT